MKLENLTVAHRGIFNNIDVPENSILAFKKSLELNFPIELDVRLTKDDILIVFHDDNLKRMTNIDKNVSDLTYKEIKNIKLLNTNQTIPTLNEVLKLVNGKVLINIEIKKSKSVSKISNIVLNEMNNYKYPFIIQSFSPRIIKYIKNHKKNITTGLLVKNTYFNKIINRMYIKYSKPNFLSISKKYIDRFKLRKFQKQYPIFIWVVKDQDGMNKYKAITNNYICNNLPYKK